MKQKIKVRLICKKNIIGYTINAYICDGVFMKDNLILCFRKKLVKEPLSYMKKDIDGQYSNGILSLDKGMFKLKIDKYSFKHWNILEIVGKSVSGEHRLFNKNFS